MAQIGWTIGARIWIRDGGRCSYCFVQLSLERGGDGGARPTIDHFVPQAVGGTSDDSNLVLACVGCNSGKEGGRVPAERIEAVAARLRGLYGGAQGIPSRPPRAFHRPVRDRRAAAARARFGQRTTLASARGGGDLARVAEAARQLDAWEGR